VLKDSAPRRTRCVCSIFFNYFCSTQVKEIDSPIKQYNNKSILCILAPITISHYSTMAQNSEQSWWTVREDPSITTLTKLCEHLAVLIYGKTYAHKQLQWFCRTSNKEMNIRVNRNFTFGFSLYNSNKFTFNFFFVRQRNLIYILCFSLQIILFFDLNLFFSEIKTKTKNALSLDLLR